MACQTEEPVYAWLTEELFEPIFEKELNLAKSEFKLKLASVKPAVGKGENYIAQVTRVKVEVTFKNAGTTYGFIIKSSLSKMGDLGELHTFEKEMEFYTEVAPYLEKLDLSVRFSPKCYFVGDVGDTKLIILEDLSQNGFKMADRLAGLDLEHCKMYFNKIGAFHALTATYYETNKVTATFEKSTYRKETNPIYEKWMKCMYPVVMDVLEKDENLRPYLGAAKKWDKILVEAVNERLKINPDDFNVLNHGDSWVNNMLFSYDANELPTDIWLIDYQIAYYGSPVYDIFYFFLSSPSIEVRTADHFDELIQTYHRSLVAHLKKFKYSKPIPTLRQLHMDILRKGFFSTILLFGITAISILDPEDTAPFDKLMQDNENAAKMRYKMFNNPRYIKTMVATMKFLQNRGLLESH